MQYEDLNKLDKTMICLEHLMSRFALSRKPWIAQAVVDHLEKLQTHPDRLRRESCTSLLSIWQAIALQMQQPLAANDEVCLSRLKSDSHNKPVMQPAWS